MKNALTVIILLALSILSGCTGKPPVERGVHDGSLLPCPDRPNCISTMSQDKDHFVHPLQYSVDRKSSISAVKEIVTDLERTVIKEEKDDYLWVECSTKIMGFVDDLEFYFPEDEKVVHVRSASRLGYSDLGVNKKRVEKIRELFSHKLSPSS